VFCFLNNIERLRTESLDVMQKPAIWRFVSLICTVL